MNQVLLAGMVWAPDGLHCRHIKNNYPVLDFFVRAEITPCQRGDWMIDWTQVHCRLMGQDAVKFAHTVRHGDSVSFEGMISTQLWKRGRGEPGYIMRTVVLIHLIHWIWRKQTADYIKANSKIVVGEKSPPIPPPPEQDDETGDYYDTLPDWGGLPKNED